MFEYHIIVFGLVQGVFFRATTQKRALDFGLVGTVKNLKDGTVEIIVQGEKETIESFLESLKENAGAAKIEHLKVSKRPVSKPFDSFQISSEL